MKGTHKNEHQDVITIIASSDQSFDDAVAQGIKQLKDPSGPHKDLEFTSYEVVKMQGTICDRGDSCDPEFYQVVMNVAGSHSHDH
ncbi:dodecin domain-containing protein [Crocosphaera sp.]|uniref:dodecin domain-containing protein n=1 Tax=Crocosphaera sp. TaxID=2729996 RepID=UPI0026193CA0|nr:dodecin domain-containing protein [Crocosphaera sp.]MDJ0582306.1 dodecin domain-containing protein [Crocosphaera sp.]